MNYIMAFLIGIMINMGYVKVWLALQARNPRVTSITIHWGQVVFDALFWGLVTLVAFFFYHMIHG